MPNAAGILNCDQIQPIVTGQKRDEPVARTVLDDKMDNNAMAMWEQVNVALHRWSMSQSHVVGLD